MEKYFVRIDLRLKEGRASEIILQKHFDYLHSLCKTTKMKAGGFSSDNEVGMIIFKAHSESHAKLLCDNDPIFSTGLYSYKLFKWNVLLNSQPESMLDHISIGCSNLGNSMMFYDSTLGQLGYERVFTGELSIGYSHRGEKDDQFAVKLNCGTTPPGLGFHVAFTAPLREAVNSFYESALKCGGKDNGAPGPRPQYGAEYYAAFIIDLDGHPIEAVYQAK